MLILGLVDAGLFAVCIVAAHLSRNGSSGPVVEGGFGVLALLGVVLVYLYFRDRPVVSEEGIIAPGFLPITRAMRWADVAYFGFDSRLGWFVIKDRTGRTVHVSTMLKGLSEFARFAVAAVPQSAFAPKMADMLQFMAEQRSL